MIHLCVDKALVYFDCESEFSASSHLHIHSASVNSNIIPVFVSKHWTHFVSVSSQDVYDLASFFEHFKLKIMAISFKLHLFKVAFSLWNWRTNMSQSVWTVDNWCQSHCWCLFVDLKVEVTQLWRRLPASQPLCALFSLRGLYFFFFFLSFYISHQTERCWERPSSETVYSLGEHNLHTDGIATGSPTSHDTFEH